MTGARSRSARAAMIVLGALIVVAVAAPWIAPYHYREQLGIVAQQNLGPSAHHLFGTDTFSRDVFSRVVYGSRVSLGVAGVSVIVALLMGVGVGATAGLAGGATDRVLMGVINAGLAVPRLLVLIVVGAAFGQMQFYWLAIVIGLTGWPGMARLVRARVREVATLDYVTAARALGVRRSHILARHVLPAVAPQILVAATLAVASVIPLEAALSFLGLGVPQPVPSWGNIMFEGYDTSLRTWWLIVFPGLAIVITVLAVNVLGDRLRESFDPRLRTPAL